ncbi:MAG TPA: SOS response-associated peptidase [Steroidobacteraceae bacterium]|nr:SOS response-associated peptidase [Steroidobacteraceae bacterium]HRX88174.1 SOS response-associated peptidase [Steroidobacteraceae bacterium]
MCGRYAFYSPQEAVARLFGVTSAAPLEPRYNICPTQFVPVVRTGAARVRELAMLYWGLVPFWAKEKSLGARMINARAETVAAKPAFRAAYRKRRCLVLADGYYEWRPSAQGKQPYFIRAADGQPLAMAGLWESWGTGEVLESCTIITTAALGSVAELHDRMPRILPATRHSEWLDPATELESLEAVLGAPVEVDLAFHPVSKRVNSPRNEGPELIAPIRD